MQVRKIAFVPAVHKDAHAINPSDIPDLILLNPQSKVWCIAHRGVGNRGSPRSVFLCFVYQEWRPAFLAGRHETGSTVAESNKLQVVPASGAGPGALC